MAMTALIIAKGRVAWVSLEVTDRGSELIGELLASLGTVVGATLRGHASCWHVIDVRWLIARRSGASHGPKTCQRIQAGLIESLICVRVIQRIHTVVDRVGMVVADASRSLVPRRDWELLIGADSSCDGCPSSSVDLARHLKLKRL